MVDKDGGKRSILRTSLLAAYWEILEYNHVKNI